MIRNDAKLSRVVKVPGYKGLVLGNTRRAQQCAAKTLRAVVVVLSVLSALLAVSVTFLNTSGSHQGSKEALVATVQQDSISLEHLAAFAGSNPPEMFELSNLSFLEGIDASEFNVTSQGADDEGGFVTDGTRTIEWTLDENGYLDEVSDGTHTYRLLHDTWGNTRFVLYDDPIEGWVTWIKIEYEGPNPGVTDSLNGLFHPFTTAASSVLTASLPTYENGEVVPHQPPVCEILPNRTASFGMMMTSTS